MRDIDERKALLEKACISIVDMLEKVITQFNDTSDTPNLRDDYDKIHLRMLQLTSTELELSYLLRKSLEVKREVDTNSSRAKEVLKDSQMEAVNKPTFRHPSGYSSRSETDGKLRSLTFEENYDVAQWDRLLIDVNYLIAIINSHQSDISKQRRDIDTRLKIKGFQY